MTEKKTGRDVVSERLHKAIEGLRKDVTRVEIWATALFTFSQPIPDYRADPKFELGQPLDTGPLTENEAREEPGKGGEKPSK